MDGIPPAELATLIATLIAGGLATGFLSGLLGIGGGGVTVPILYELFRVMGISIEVRMHVCVGTALAIIIPTSIRSAYAHFRRGSFDRTVFMTLAPWVTAGAIIGVFVAARVPGAVLQVVFIASSVFMAWRIAFGANKHTGKDGALPGHPWDAMVGLFIGALSALIGIGGGSYITAYMSMFGWPIQAAVGTASGFGPMIAIPATLGYITEGWGISGLPPFSLGYVSLIGAAIIAPVSVLTAPFGVRVAHALKRRQLEYVFIGFLLFVAWRFLSNLIWPS